MNSEFGNKSPTDFIVGCKSTPVSAGENDVALYKIWWEMMDSNHRSLTTTDLQSAPFGHSGNLPNGGC